MLSIISVNYFGKEVLQKCLHSVMEQTNGLDYEIIVVDNANDAVTRQLIEALPKAVRWLNMGYNAGFGRANNFAFKQAKGDVFLLLNPDCYATDNVVADCYYQFIESNDVACGVQLLNDDGSAQISGHYAMKGGLNYLLPLPYIGPFLSWAGNALKMKKPRRMTLLTRG